MKTISLKKVSAVAVASLGFGLLSVVPAQAAATANTGAVFTNTDATLAANQSTSVNTLVGVATALTLKSISTAGAAGNMDITMTATLPANAAGVTTNAIGTGVWGTFVVNTANSTCTTPSAAVMRSAAGAGADCHRRQVERNHRRAEAVENAGVERDYRDGGRAQLPAGHRRADR